MTAKLISIRDFVAYDLPTKKVLNMFCAKMRVRVRVGNQEFVSSTAKAGNRGETTVSEDASVSCTQWDDDFSMLELDNDELFEVEIEKRRFLGWYECIRRTGRTTIRRIREERNVENSDSMLTLPLYDGQSIGYAGQHGGQCITMGEITFMPTYASEGSLSDEGQRSA